MTEYKGFTIDQDFGIHKAGHKWFTYERCNSVEDCEIVIDAYYMAKELFRKMPNLSKIEVLEVLNDENGVEEREDADRWSEAQAEQELINHEENY